MTIITTYVCDNCAREQPEPDQMWNLGLLCSHAGETRFHSTESPRHRALWCRACCDAARILLPRVLDADWEAPPKATFESMIRALINEEQGKDE